MPWNIINCEHMTVCADHDDKVKDIYYETHHERDIDPCEDYDYYYYTEREVLEALGHAELTDGDVL